MKGQKKLVTKEQNWDLHIKAWQKSKLTQARYCQEHGLSQSDFSKWKKKLHPKLKAARPAYKTKSKYYKFTKVADKEIEFVMRCFLNGNPARIASERTGLNQNTIYKIYNDFRLAIIDGALNYPHLFYGGGMVLLLGPPANLDWIKSMMNRYFPGFKATTSQGKIRSRSKSANKDISTLKTNIQIITLVLFWHSFHEWSEEEIFVFRKWGYMLFYQYIYAPEHNLKPNEWSDDIHRKLYGEYSGTVVARGLWDYWALVRNYEPFLPADTWTMLFSDRKFRTPLDNKVWFDRMFSDFKWLLKKHRIGDDKTYRSTYWDEYYPPTEATLEVEQKLNEKFKAMFPETFEKYVSNKK